MSFSRSPQLKEDMENKKAKGFILGSFGASILASACCIGPIILAVLGVSSAGILSSFEPYRGLISIAAVSLLGLSFYFTYRKKPGQECKEDIICANPKSQIWNKRFLWLTTFLILAILTFPDWSIFLF
jgi:mercuric ion transport protein